MEHSGTGWPTWDAVGKIGRGDGRGMCAPESKAWSRLGRVDTGQLAEVKYRVGRSREWKQWMEQATMK